MNLTGDNFLDATLLITAFIFLIAAVCYFAVRVMVLVPISRILEYAQAIMRNKKAIPIKAYSWGKIGMLARCVNEMGDRINSLENREEWVKGAKADILALAAHQLRTPLTALHWSLAGLRNAPATRENSEQRNYVEVSEKASRRMINLVNSLLVVTSMEKGRYGYNMKRADMARLVTGVLKSAYSAAEEKNIKINTKISESILIAEIDEMKIGFVLDNLLSNAIDYTPEGGSIEVSVFSKDAGAGGNIVFCVKDTGIGIAGYDLKNVFSEFFRTQQAVRMNDEGAGLGLFLSKNIVEGHGGKIWAESDGLGKGAKFCFSIPTHQQYV